MQTPYDWLCVVLFAFIALTFLRRSVTAPDFPDPAYRYLPPVIGCVAANWAGNSGHTALALAILALSVLYYATILRPFRSND